MSVTKLNILVLFLTTSFCCKAQCGTDYLDSMNFVQFISKGGSINQYRNIHEPSKKKLGKTNFDETLTIPVVFHIIHNYGPENISEAQINDQIRIINEDFQKLNADTIRTDSFFIARAASIGIEFKLAKIDPEGNCTKGITRHQSWLTNEPEYNDCKGLVIWDPKKYLNIWVVKSIGKVTNKSIVLGYSSLPRYGGDSLYDGVVLRADCVGSIEYARPQSIGRTLTHEVGHWLGLHHPFKGKIGTFFPGDGCNWSNDFVDDTPPVTDPNYWCPSSVNSCHLDQPDEPDNIQNFMDYTADSCKNMFTMGQRDRILSHMNDSNYRAGIVSEFNLKETGVNLVSECGIQAAYTTYNDSKIICEGVDLQYIDKSYNGKPTKYNWTFDGGNPKFSNHPNPVVHYSKPGLFDVQLVVTDKDNNSNDLVSDTMLSRHEVMVLEKNASIIPPYKNNLAHESTILGYYLENMDKLGWRYSSKLGYKSSGCLIAKNDSTKMYGNVASLVLPSIDLTKHKGSAPFRFSFRYAYKRPIPFMYEKLNIYASTDCGSSWRHISEVINWCTAGGTYSRDTCSPEFDWEPNNYLDWDHHQIDIDSFRQQEHLLLRIDFIPNKGNSFYLDDLNIDQNLLDVKDVDAKSLTLYPNPSIGCLNLRGIDNYEVNQIEIVNDVGSIVKVIYSDFNKEINVKGLATGLYFLKINTATEVIILKFIRD